MTGAVLVLRALGLGDLLTAVPALRALRTAFRHQRIVLAAPAGLADLVPLVGAVDELRPTSRLGELSWKEQKPLAAINLHGKGPESIADLLTTRPTRLVSYRHPYFPEVPGPAWQEQQHEVDRWCCLLACHGIATDPNDLVIDRPNITSPAAGAVVVHPGAAFPARRWPKQRYASVAREVSGNGYQVVITGSREELDVAHSVAAAAGLSESAVLAGRTTLAQLAQLVADAALVICGDTGVGHLATAYGTPSVLLFGPISPDQWGPPPDKRQHRAVWAGRFGNPWADRPDAGLLQINEDDVLDAISQVLRTSMESVPVSVEGGR